MSFADREFCRVKHILATDKSNNPKNLSSVIKSEITDILVNYMDVRAVDYKCKLNSDNSWTVAVIVNANSFYSIKSTFND